MRQVDRTCSRSWTLGARIFSHTFWSTSPVAKSVWCTELATVARNLIEVVTSKSWCGASEVAIRSVHTSPRAADRFGSKASSSCEGIQVAATRRREK
jgi:hypothetical protein